MKIYFDSLDMHLANHEHLTESGGMTWWIVSKGPIIKRKLDEMGIAYQSLDTFNEPGAYFIDVNGDPHWWCGIGRDPGSPKKHILEELRPEIKELIKHRKLRIIITADKEGGPMWDSHFDCFKKTTDIMIAEGFPPNSVLITHGNRKVIEQYDQWLIEKNQPVMFELHYSCHFGKIFYDDKLPEIPVALESIGNQDAKDYNSLNRVYRHHRGAHLYLLARDTLLEHGLVSANQIQPQDRLAAELANTDMIYDVETVLEEFYPRYVDGNWAEANAANQYNVDIYKNSLLTVITETMFEKDVTFLSEKVFKPLAIGHPLLLISTPGSLRTLREMGFRTDWCEIDDSYDEIENPKRRMQVVHELLREWIQTPRHVKIDKIVQSSDVLIHNMEIMKQSDFYNDAVRRAITSTEAYFK